MYIYSLPDAPGARYIIGVESEQLEKELKLSHTVGKGHWVVPGTHYHHYTGVPFRNKVAPDLRGLGRNRQ